MTRDLVCIQQGGQLGCVRASAEQGWGVSLEGVINDCPALFSGVLCGLQARRGELGNQLEPCFLASVWLHCLRELERRVTWSRSHISPFISFSP